MHNIMYVIRPIILYFRIQVHGTLAIENCVYNFLLFFVHSSVEQMAVPFMKLQGNPQPVNRR